MFPFVKYMLQLACLGLFSISIFLPVSFTVLTTDPGNISYHVHHHNRMIRMSIGSINAILIALADRDPDDLNGDGSADGSPVLVAHHNALVRLPISPKPMFTVALAPAGPTESLLHAPCVYDHPEVSRYQETEIFLALNTGVSPPLFVSPSQQA
jgi:hypothetical protein